MAHMESERTTKYEMGGHEYVLRRYKYLGKYEGGLVIDEIVHCMSLEGCDEEEGSCSENGYWYGLLRGPFKSEGEFANISATARLDFKITRGEIRFLADVAGAIVKETDQGFVSVEYYDDVDRMREDWAEIVADFAEIDGEVSDHDTDRKEG